MENRKRQRTSDEPREMDGDQPFWAFEGYTDDRGVPLTPGESEDINMKSDTN